MAILAQIGYIVPSATQGRAQRSPFLRSGTYANTVCPRASEIGAVTHLGKKHDSTVEYVHATLAAGTSAPNIWDPGTYGNVL